MSVNEQAVV